MAECLHQEFQVFADVRRLTNTETPNAPVIEFRVDLRVICFQCQEPFFFKGLPRGYRPHTPTMNMDGTEARLAIAPLPERALYAGRTLDA